MSLIIRQFFFSNDYLKENLYDRLELSYVSIFLVSKIGRQISIPLERTVASFETHEVTDGQLSKNKTCENEF